jgi:hypothetical protein
MLSFDMLHAPWRQLQRFNVRWLRVAVRVARDHELPQKRHDREDFLPAIPYDKVAHQGRHRRDYFI